ncbi:MAG: DUF1653 domain-containing protein [Pseudomonadota bacterium]
MMNIKSGDIFKHYKGGIYTVLHVGYDANNSRDLPTKTKVVIYMDHVERNIWTRDFEEFCSLCDDGKSRFTKIT